MNPNELEILLTAKDRASGVLRAVAGVLTGALVGALSDAANAAAADEANVLKLQTAVENSHASWEANVAIIEDVIAAGQALAFSDDQTRDALATLVTTTGSLQKALALLPSSMDIARAKSVDLETAALAVGRAHEGNATTLKKLMGIVDDTSSATHILAEAQTIAAGQAERYGDSTKGSIDKVKDSIDEWKESIGAAMGPAQGFIALLPGMSNQLIAVTGVLALLTPAQQAATAAFAASAAPFLLVIAVIALVVVALMQIWETVTLVTDNWDKFVFALKTGKLNDIPVFGFFFEKIQQILAGIDVVVGAWNGLQKLFGASVEAGGAGTSGAGGQIESFADGGIVPGPIGAPRLVIAHGGEPIGRSAGAGSGGGITVNLNGPVYGMADFENQVASAVRRVKQGGGFRGVLA